MKTEPIDLTIRELLELRKQQMLIINQEYQRGTVWTKTQKRKLLDSVLRGYPIPLIYLHHVKRSAGNLVSERYEVIDGQQRIDALSDFRDNVFPLFDPVKDEVEARFPDFIKKQACPWGGKHFEDLPESLQEALLNTSLRIVKIETHDANEARDLFVRLQSGMPLNSQEKRDAWPGQFTEFVLRLGGKQGLNKYPGHDFFNILMSAQRVKDRGKFRQLAAQIAILFMTRRKSDKEALCDINAAAIDDFYYENLDFDVESPEAARLLEVLAKVTELLRDQKRSKVVGHEAIHLVLLADTLMGNYAPSWEERFAEAFDHFRERFTQGKKTRNDAAPDEYWLRYGMHTRANSDRADVIQRRHEFFCSKMHEILKPQMKDAQRLFGPLERELVYYRDKKRCGECDGVVNWADIEIHHVEEHAKGGQTTLENAALVHKLCHPKGSKAVEFAKKWRERKAAAEFSTVNADDSFEDDDENEDAA